MEDRINAILDFIDQQPDVQPVLSQPEQPSVQSPVQPSEQASPAQPPTQAIPAQTAIVQGDSLPIYQDSKTYTNIQTRLRKIRSYPYILKLPDQNILFNSESEMLVYRNDLTNKRKEYNKQQRAKKLSESKMNLDDLPQVEDETQYITEDGMMYKRREPDAIIKGDKMYKVPKTNPQDTKKIYKNIAKSKENLKKLAKTKNDEEFDQTTRESITDEEIKRIYNQHITNDINPDKTWTRDSFYRYMVKMIDEQNASKQRPRIPPGLPRIPNAPVRSPAVYGLNPALLGK